MPAPGFVFSSMTAGDCCAAWRGPVLKGPFGLPEEPGRPKNDAGKERAGDADRPDTQGNRVVVADVADGYGGSRGNDIGECRDNPKGKAFVRGIHKARKRPERAY